MSEETTNFTNDSEGNLLRFAQSVSSAMTEMATPFTNISNIAASLNGIADVYNLNTIIDKLGDQNLLNTTIKNNTSHVKDYIQNAQLLNGSIDSNLNRLTKNDISMVFDE